MSDFKLDTALAFDRDKQAAIVGWALRDQEFFNHAVQSIDADWLADPYLGKVWSACCEFHREFHRRITAKELKTHPPFLQEDPRTQALLLKAIEGAIGMSKRYGLDVLRKEITSWMKAVIFSQGVQQSVLQYNAQKVDEAWKILDQAAIRRRSASFEEGVQIGFRPASERILSERKERMEQSTKILPYGIQYYDDALGGIITNDLVVIGAKTNAGKTQLATAIALSTCAAGYPAHYFALEAEESEIERRIKYGMIADAYYSEQYQNGNTQSPEIDYKRWRLGRLDGILGPLEAKLEDQIRKAVQNLNTLYRTSGGFDLANLEHSLMSVVHDTRLIVIDHLHYVDTDDDENMSYKKVCKTIRDIVLRYGVPVILVAHLRKTQGGFRGTTLLPMLEEFHGTSDVPKIATTCLMMAPAHDQVQTKPWLWPTYLGALKSRLDGSVTRFVGVTDFNRRTNRYEARYSVGKMEEMGKLWAESVGEQVPHWAEGAAPLDSTANKPKPLG